MCDKYFEITTFGMYIFNEIIDEVGVKKVRKIHELWHIRLKTLFLNIYLVNVVIILMGISNPYWV